MTDANMKSRYTRAENFLDGFYRCPAGSFGKCLGKVITCKNDWGDVFEVDNTIMGYDDAVRYLAFGETPKHAVEYCPV